MDVVRVEDPQSFGGGRGHDERDEKRQATNRNPAKELRMSTRSANADTVGWVNVPSFLDRLRRGC